MLMLMYPLKYHIHFCLTVLLCSWILFYYVVGYYFLPIYNVYITPYKLINDNEFQVITCQKPNCIYKSPICNGMKMHTCFPKLLPLRWGTKCYMGNSLRISVHSQSLGASVIQVIV